MKKRILSMVLMSGFFLTGYPSQAIAQSQEIQLNLRTQILIQDEAKRNTWQIINRKKTIPTSKIAIIICDMWDKHWSRGATERIDEMAPRMNQVVKAARAKGIQIIHAPSERCVKFYRKTPARQRMIAAMPTNFTFAESIVAEGEKGARNSIKDFICKIKQKIKSVSKREKPSPYPPLPFFCPDGGSDTNHGNEFPHRVWTRQHPAIEIKHEKGVISDNGKEIYNFLRQRGITDIAIMGVHTNICILNRSFGTKNMIKREMRVVLVRDLTDAMYNPANPPYVSHEEGTRLVIGYIEKFYCPTITSSDLIDD